MKKMSSGVLLGTRDKEGADKEVFFAVKGGTVPASLAPDIEGFLVKRGGSHGGSKSWKSRWCTLRGHTLYYCEDPSSKTAKGHVQLQGVGVSEIGHTQRFGVDIFWPNAPHLVFRLQAPSAEVRTQWVEKLRGAAEPTAEALGELMLEELQTRCKLCELPDTAPQAELASSLLRFFQERDTLDDYSEPAQGEEQSDGFKELPPSPRQPSSPGIDSSRLSSSAAGSTAPSLRSVARRPSALLNKVSRSAL